LALKSQEKKFVFDSDATLFYQQIQMRGHDRRQTLISVENVMIQVEIWVHFLYKDEDSLLKVP